MPVIVAHQEDCDIVKHGPVETFAVGPGGSSFKEQAMVCSCGGVMVHAEVWATGDKIRLLPESGGIHSEE